MSAPAPASEAPGSSLRQRRHSSGIASATDAVIDAAKNVEAKVERAVLVLWDDLPHWRQDNAYIMSGYRDTSNSYRKSLQSLGWLHNESVNIWSHLLGAVGFAIGGTFLYAVVAPRYESASASDLFVFGCFFAGAFLCLGMSATYHALSNHSPDVAKWGNKLDYTGIVFLILGSYVPALWYGLFCEPKLLTIYLSAIVALGLGCLVVSWFEHFRQPRWRPYRAMMFVGLGVSSVFPVVHGLITHGWDYLDERMGLRWVLLQGGLYIFGAFLYAIRWPECQWPGAFDIWGSSHQIFHVLIVMAASFHLYGMAKAFDFHHSVMGSQC